MKKVIKTCSVNPGLVSIDFMHTAKLSDLILSVQGSNRGLVLLRLAVRGDHANVEILSDSTFKKEENLRVKSSLKQLSAVS